MRDQFNKSGWSAFGISSVIMTGQSEFGHAVVKIETGIILTQFYCNKSLLHDQGLGKEARVA